ncbi:MAG: 3'-5' exonuclease, partial [Alphaproteobacteria bacterium]
RRLRPGDILVLVRRRNAFVEELVRELKRLDVPVAGVDRMVLREQMAVMDLIALGRVLLLPEDDLTLATVLKGPLVGLSEEHLFTLAHNRRGTLWDALRAAGNGDDPAIATAYMHLSELLARADFAPPHELFAEILARDWGRGISGREVLLARLGPEANDPIEELLSLTLDYEREHVPSLEGFLHWLEIGAQEVKRDMEHGRDSVRVMTVHGAKGLQAPVVILPDTMQTPLARGGLLWLAPGHDPDDDLLVWSPRKDTDGPVTRAARTARQEAQEREYRRLLYVALTRAEDRLYVCGWQTGKTIKDACWYSLVAAALADIGEAVPFDFSAEIDGGWAGEGWRLTCPQSATSEHERDDVPVHAAAPEPLPAWARTAPPPEPAPPRPLAPSRPSTLEPAVISPLGDDEGSRFQRGRLIHRLLQSLPDVAPAARGAAAARLLARPVYALSAADQDEIASASLAVLAHPDFAPLFGPDSRAEVPIAGLVGSGPEAAVIAGQVDRLVVTDAAVLILDYKTNRPAPRHERDVPPVYLRQMAAYRAVLASIYPEHRIDCALLWTDGPRLMQLSGDILTTCAP